MIRRKLSNGLLRATAQSQSQIASVTSSASSAAVSASPIQQQTAHLASAVLLGSQRNWKKETVQEIKSELKRRGLSQQGNKNTLIARITSAETSALLPPTPTIPKTLASATTKSRSISSSPTRSSPARNKKTETPLVQETDKITTTGVPVASKRGEAKELEPVPKENITVAPGLPESKNDATDLSGFSVKMPKPYEEKDYDQIIPVEPDNFRSQKSASKAESTEPETPKVMTVASAATHLSGGPVHAIHESADSHAEDQKSESSSGNKEILKAEFEGAGAALASAVNSVVGAGLTVGEFSRAVIPKIGLPSSGSGSGSGSGKQSEYKPSDKPLDEEERRGIWILGGLVGIGFLLGGGKSNPKVNLKEKAHEAVEKVKDVAGSKSVKGDAQWAKASGAGVVGHGSRKA